MTTVITDEIVSVFMDRRLDAELIPSTGGWMAVIRPSTPGMPVLGGAEETTATITHKWFPTKEEAEEFARVHIAYDKLTAVAPMMLLAGTTKRADGAITIDELVEFICASVEKLGYPVGMGIRPNADSMKSAALKLKRLMDASYSDGYAAAAAFKEHAHDPTDKPSPT